MKKYYVDKTPLGKPQHEGQTFSILIIILALFCILLLQSIPTQNFKIKHETSTKKLR
jgi:hypothetical protein